MIKLLAAILALFILWSLLDGLLWLIGPLAEFLGLIFGFRRR